MAREVHRAKDNGIFTPLVCVGDRLTGAQNLGTVLEARWKQVIQTLKFEKGGHGGPLGAGTVLYVCPRKRHPDGISVFKNEALVIIETDEPATESQKR